MSSTSDILTDEMTLEEKLKAIEQAMKSAVSENVERVRQGLAPVDPASLTICDGCE